jgi:hypothetical protein
MLGGLLSGRECPNGRDDFTDIIGCLYVDIPALGLRRIGAGVVEIWGEVFPPQYNLRNSGCWRVVEWEGVL